jgi:hypothetical protein
VNISGPTLANFHATSNLAGIEDNIRRAAMMIIIRIQPNVLSREMEDQTCKKRMNLMK